MSSLVDTIETIYQGGSHSMINRMNTGSHVPSAPTTAKLYMEIPIGSDVFELPLLAYSAFRDMLSHNRHCDTLVAQIYSCGLESSYKSLDAIMKDVLTAKPSLHLCKVRVPGSPTVYYSTYGTVFDSRLKPLMMLSWVFERKADDNGKVKYHYKKPLLRLNPQTCLLKEDALQRFMAGRMLTGSLESYVTIPYFVNMNEFLEQTRSYTDRRNFHVRIEIDECPFVIRGVDIPSISLTNEALLQMAADHIDEILQ